MPKQAIANATSARRRAPRLCGPLLVSALIPAAALAQAPPPSGFPGEAPEGPPPRILSFSADATEIESGDSTTLRWAGINAYTLTIEPDIGVVATRGSRDVAPGATTAYTLTITGTGGSTSKTVTVRVAGTVARAPAEGSVTPEPRAIPRLASGKPDLSGVYLGGRGIRMDGDVRVADSAERFRVEQRDGDLGQGALCLPPGVPAATMVPYPLQIVHKDDLVVILYEAYNLFRIIPIGADHPDDLDPTWMGNSVAHWDGDTLVVDVAGFNDKTRIAGYRHTEDMHVVERYRRTAYDTIEYEASVEDPNVFAEPVRYAGDLVLHPEWQIGEYVCAENNKSYDELFSD